MVCHHEPLRHCQSFSDVRSLFDSGVNVGVCDTGASFFDYHTLTDFPIVKINRDVDEIHRSLVKIIPHITRQMVVRCVNSVNDVVADIECDYHQIDEYLPSICEVIGVPYNKERHDMMTGQMLTVKLSDIAHTNNLKGSKWRG